MLDLQYRPKAKYKASPTATAPTSTLAKEELDTKLVETLKQHIQDQGLWTSQAAVYMQPAPQVQEAVQAQPAPQDQTARGGVPEPTHPPAPQHGQLPCAGSPVAQATSQDEEGWDEKGVWWEKDPNIYGLWWYWSPGETWRRFQDRSAACLNKFIFSPKVFFFSFGFCPSFAFKDSGSRRS